MTSLSFDSELMQNLMETTGRKVNVRCRSCNVRWEVVKGPADRPWRNDWKGSWVEHQGQLVLASYKWPSKGVYKTCARQHEDSEIDDLDHIGIMCASASNARMYYECICGIVRMVNVAKLQAAVVDALLANRRDIFEGIDF